MPDLEIKASGKSADWSDLRKAAAGLGVEIKVGFLSGQQHQETRHDKTKPKKGEGGKNATPGQMEVSELARILHYGTATIPARPFLEDAIEKNEDAIYKAIEKQVNKALSGQTPRWSEVGTLAVGKVQEHIRSDEYKERVPNAKSTIKRKGSDRPLIDGGNLWQSVKFEVETK